MGVSISFPQHRIIFSVSKVTICNIVVEVAAIAVVAAVVAAAAVATVATEPTFQAVEPPSSLKS